MSTPAPTTALVLRDDGAEAARRLRFATADVVVVADHRLAGAMTPAVVEALAESLERHRAAAMVVALVVDPETGEAWPTPPGLAATGHPLPAAPAPVEVAPTFVPGAVWAVRRDSLEAVGGLDGDATPTLAAVDLAWRLWLAGPRVLIDPSIRVPGPQAVVPSPLTGPAAVAAEADALAMVERNFGGHRQPIAARLARALSTARLAALDPDGTDPAAGLARFDAEREHRVAARERVQSGRRRPDVEIVQLMGDPLGADLQDPGFLAAHREARDAIPGLDAFTHRWRIVVATADSLSTQVAGPAIRALRIARELAVTHDVHLVSLTKAELTDPAMRISTVPFEDVGELLHWADVFVFQGWVLSGSRVAAATDTVLIADIYDPLHLEQLEQSRDEGEYARRHAVRHATAVLNEQLLRGDHFLCASDKQRDLWLGSLAAMGRINPATYDDDPGLASLLSVVPFGTSDDPPVRTAPAIKGTIPGIADDDLVVLWGGGVYNWFDPLSLIRAVARLAARVPKVRLVFLGMRHPNPEVPVMSIADACRRLADELGVTGVNVFFNEGWVPFDQRQNFLLDADVAVTTHFQHVETEFSFRTRVLDYLWAGIPTVSTSGDSLAALIEREGLGLTVPPEDVDALEGALHRLLTDAELAADCRRHIAEIGPSLTWSVALEPLVRFCAAPRRAPDLMEGLVVPAHGPPLLVLGGGAVGPSAFTRVRRDLRILRDHLRHGGVTLVYRRVVSRVRRLAGRPAS